jgi:2',3'-cyclic-nucleotide 2'-phosphodiesterase (5'-nucleotidase family)
VIGIQGVLWMGLAGGLTLADTVGQTRTRLDTLNADKQETTFGDLAADAFRSAANAEIALVDASAFLPGGINPGPVSTDQVAGLLKFPDDRLILAELSGDVVRRMLERSVSVYPGPNVGFLQVSGLRFTFDPGKPADNRVTQIEVVSGASSEALDPARTYRVATSTTIGRGGLGYFKIVSPNPKITKLETTVIEAITKHVRSSGPIQFGDARRIIPR